MAGVHIFIHIPKCAGTTIVKLAREHYSPDEIHYIKGLDESRRQLESMPAEQKDKIRFVHGHHYYGWHEYFPGAKYITVLREPLDRIISHYYFAKRAAGHHFHKIIHDNDLDVLGYVKTTRSKELNNGQTRMLYGNHKHFGFGKNKRELLDTALRHIDESFSIVGVQENFPEVLAALEKKLGWTIKGNPVNNAAPERIKVEELAPEAADYIREVNQLDIELYEKFKNRTIQ